MAEVLTLSVCVACEPCLIVTRWDSGLMLWIGRESRPVTGARYTECRERRSVFCNQPADRLGTIL